MNVVSQVAQHSCDSDHFQSITETREATVGCSFVSRISDVNSALRQRLYRHVSRCLTRPHQLLFAFLMAVALLKDR